MSAPVIKRMFVLLPALAISLIAAVVVWQYQVDPGADQPALAVTDYAAQIRQGAYLVRASDCIACHTARGGAAFAGGRAVPTPFGTLYSPNITSDKATGLGTWSADQFWRALHNGKSPDGNFLYPAFPYPNYTKITRADADAMFAYLQTQAPIARQNLPHALRFPYNQRPLLALWRALYFKPASYQPDPRYSAAWNRGAYLVQGPGHCNACHAQRNQLGAPADNLTLAGGLIPSVNWYAPPLAGASAGLHRWSQSDLEQFLKTGISSRGAAFGPMAEVIGVSLQHLDDTDISAIAIYLKAQPQGVPGTRERITHRAPEQTLQLGRKLYEDHCMDCHQADGTGAPPHYPPLANNPAVTLPRPTNTIRLILNGGYPPSTAGNPRPYGMPPFGASLTDTEIAALLSYIREQWGNQAEPVDALEIRRNRIAPIE